MMKRMAVNTMLRCNAMDAKLQYNAVNTTLHTYAMDTKKRKLVVDNMLQHNS